MTPYLSRPTYAFIGSIARGPVDRVFARTDCSAFIVKNTLPDDPRLEKTPYKWYGYGVIDRQYTQLPSIDY
jgi:hypothetical protein